MKFELITILGPTATGKTNLAVQLAKYFDGEIISADSRQVYKSMNIGTGKDLNEYNYKGKNIPYYMIDIIEPSEEFNLFLFKKYFKNYFDDIFSRNKMPFLVGGTGLYLSAILNNYNLATADFENEVDKLSNFSDNELKKMLLDLNQKLHNTTDLKDRNRIIKAIIISKTNQEKDQNPAINSFNIGITLPRDEIKNRITRRLKNRLSNGMIEEVKLLLDSGISYEKILSFGLEYKFIAQYLKGELNYNDMFQKLNSAIHSFAKRQMTWFRKMESEGININWVNGPDFNKAKELIEKGFAN
ncbi:MAG: tRNA (adenosine(37)-N6)-dimethylallyltransferase MiaA [Ignavibacteriaceae bacterium]